jgi:type I restriction enzyme S subunit
MAMETATQEEALRRYRPYPAYKDSGVEWLGEIPEHWALARLKEVVVGIEQGWSPLCENRQADLEEWAVLKVGCVNGESFNEAEHKALPQELNPVVDLEIQPGDILMSRANTRELLGSAALVKHVRARLILCDKLYRIRVRLGLILPEFVVRAISSCSVRYQLERDATGASSSMQNVSQEAIRNLLVLLPPKCEQHRIASFLDRETARIDALVAKKQRLIELLQEQRTALITRAVTKGLDPCVPMKDSGVEWLGEIPEHWDLCAVWIIFALGRGRVISHEEIYENQGVYPVYSSQTEDNGVMGYLATYDFDGDYLTWTTDGANAGTVFARNEKFNCTNVCGTLKPRRPSQIDLCFARDALNIATACFVRHDINPKLMNNVMARIKLQLPPPEEQVIISEYLYRETMRIDALVMKICDAIARLQELRNALISAAVTGKIDVRQEVA